MQVIDFARFLDVGSTQTEPAEHAADNVAQTEDERRIIVINQQGMYLGMRVDEVESIVGYDVYDIVDMPDHGSLMLLDAEPLIKSLGSHSLP